MTTNNERELWDPLEQGRDSAAVAERADSGIKQAWDRVWEQPVSFYRRKFEEAGLSPGAVPALSDIPRTNKAELRADEDLHPPFGTYRSVTLDQAVRIGASTGTTGRPTLFFYSAHDLEVHVEMARRTLWRHGMRRGGRWTHSWPQGIYPTGVSAGRQYLDLGILEIPVGPPFTPEVAADHVRLWELLRPTGFMVTGSQLQTYDSVAQEAGIDLAALTAGGILAFLEASCQFEGPRKRLESAYGIRLHNIGGASEIPGFSTSDCRFHTGLHCAPDHYVIEVCDLATGREVAPGERGSLVVTAFGIDATFVRYDLEDVVTEHVDPCPCGETGSRYTLLGRSADVVTVDDRAILPIDVQLALEDAGSPEFQVVRSDRRDALRLKVESETEGGPLAAMLTESLGVPVEIETIAVGTLPRATFKPRRLS